MQTPKEFSAGFVEQHSPLEEQLYTAFLKSGEPYVTLRQPDFHISAKGGHIALPDPELTNPPGLNLEDESLYYNTSGEAAAYWADFSLPHPAKDIRQLRADLKEWGYCLIEDALSLTQLNAVRDRLYEQAHAERLAGIASWMGVLPAPGHKLPNMQFIHSLINKGEMFAGCLEHDSKFVQAGPVIEQLLTETLGPGFLSSSFIAIIANQFNQPQGLHQDQNIAPFQETVAPFSCNTLYVIDDMGADNGGTLIIPGSHKSVSAAASGHGPATPLPPAINVEAKGGTAIVFDGRLLHGTGVNKTDRPRMVLTQDCRHPFLRQQEMHMLSADTAVLKKASQKLLYRLGLIPPAPTGLDGAWAHESVLAQRLAFDQGDYLPVPALRHDMTVEQLGAPFTYRLSKSCRKQFPHQPETLPEIQERYAEAD